MALAILVAPAAALLSPAPSTAPPAPATPVPAELSVAAASDLYGGRVLGGLDAEPLDATVSILVRLQGDPISNIILDFRATFGDQAAWPPPVIDMARAAIEARNGSLSGQRAQLHNALAAAGIDAPFARDYRYLVNGVNLRNVPAIAIRVLAANREVSFVERDQQVYVALAESVPLINADDVWNLTDGLGRNITGRGTLIANIDTGVDYSHPDLGGTLNRTNDLANLTNGTHPKFSRGWDFVNNDADPWDGHLHGTHVAGIIGANGTVKGVAPNAKQLALKVLSDAGYGGDSDIIAAMEYATNPDGNALTNDAANASSMSLGGWDPNPDGLEPLAADQSTRLGTICVIAAGNSGATNSVGSPGVSRLAITVGSTTKSDQLSGFSSQGPTLALDLKPDIVAPGSSIVSTRWGGAGGTLTLSGTSMATPHVSGAIALLAQAHPNWTVNQTKSALVDYSVDLGLGVYQQGGGRMDVLAAVNATVAATPFKVVMGRLDRLTNGTNATVTLENLGTKSVTLNLSVKDVFGMNPDMTYTGNAADQNFVNVTPATVTLAAGARDNVTITFSPSASAVPGLYWGTLSARGSNVSMRIPLAYAVRAPILLVDDDSSDRWAGNPAFDNFAGFPQATSNMSASLTRLGLKHDIFTATHYTDDGPGLADLQNYPLVIWCTGYDYDYSDGFHTHHSISTNDRAALASYLDRGGQLWLIGENIGWDVSGHTNATFSSSNFFNAYLGVARVDNELNTPNPLKGTPGTFMNNSSYATNPTWTDYGNKGDYATNLTPTARGFTIFNGSTTDVYGKTYANASLAVAVDNATYRSVFWGVEFSFLGANARYDDAVTKTMRFFAPRPVSNVSWSWEGDSVDFSGRFAWLPNESAFTVAWSFGDNGTATTRNATHTFIDEGTYTVRFTVTSGAWLNLSGSLNFTVYNAAPNAAITWSPATIKEGDVVNFTANCTDPGPADTIWIVTWVFQGAGQIDPDPGNPHANSWNNNGTYNVSVACYDNDGGVGLLTVPVVVGNADPEIRAINYTGPSYEGQTAVFNASCVDPGIRDRLALTWSWGDGSPATMGENATHVYADEGNYTVTTTCADEDGGSATNVSIVQVWNLPPTVLISGNAVVSEGSQLALLAAVTDPGIFDVFTYRWDFGDGSTAATGPGATHAYADNGQYRVTLTVWDNFGDAGLANFTVNVTNVAPTAVITIASPRVEGSPFDWSAVVSDAGANDTYSIQWFTGTALTTWGAWADDGSYLLSATVTDDDGASTVYNFTVTVENAAPGIIPFDPVPAPAENESVVLGANISDAGPWDALVVEFDFGDGTPHENVSVSDWRVHPYASTGHAYADDGDYQVVLTARDGDGGFAVAIFLVLVHNLAPTLLVAPASLEVTEGSWVNFTSGAEDPGPNDTVSVEWLFGDGGQRATGSSTEHRFERDGTFTVRATATDNAGASAVKVVTVVVLNAAPVLTVNVPGPTMQGALASFSATAIDPGPQDAVSVRWRWPDGTFSDGFDAARTFAHPGRFSATVTASDEDGGAVTTVVTFVILNAVPTIEEILTDAQLVEGTAVGFEAHINNSAQETLEFAWDFGDGATSGMALPSHSFADDGHYVVTLIVYEPDGESAQFERLLDIRNAPPTLSCSGCPTQVEQGALLVLHVEVADPGSGDAHSFLLTLQDGRGFPRDDGNFSVRLNDLGDNELVVSVDDGDGGSANLTLHVNVIPAPVQDVSTSGGFPLWLLLLLGAGAVGAVFVLTRRRRRRDES